MLQCFPAPDIAYTILLRLYKSILGQLGCQCLLLPRQYIIGLFQSPSELWRSALVQHMLLPWLLDNALLLRALRKEIAAVVYYRRPHDQRQWMKPAIMSSPSLLPNQRPFLFSHSKLPAKEWRIIFPPVEFTERNMVKPSSFICQQAKPYLWWTTLHPLIWSKLAHLRIHHYYVCQLQLHSLDIHHNSSPSHCILHKCDTVLSCQVWSTYY